MPLLNLDDLEKHIDLTQEEKEYQNMYIQMKIQ